MDKNQKQTIVEKHGKSAKDTGSTAVQIALMSGKINELTEHLRLHKKDNHSRRGLLDTVSQRRKLLKYLERQNHEQYVKLTEELAIRH